MRFQAYVNVNGVTYWVDVVKLAFSTGSIEIIVNRCSFKAGKVVVKDYDGERCWLDRDSEWHIYYLEQFFTWEKAEELFDELVAEPEKFIKEEWYK